MNEGYNILIATIVWIILLIGHTVILYQYLFKLKKGENGILVILSIILYLIPSNMLSIECYLSYVSLFSLMLVLNGYKKDIYLFDIILIFSLYIKFSLFIMVFGLFVIYLLFGYFYDKELYKYCSLRMLLGMIISPLIYFAIYGFSLINFKNYIKGSIEVASGYNVAMSINNYDIYAIWIVIAICAFLICILLGLKSGMYNFILMAFVGVCLFMSYKHGFVRADEAHIIFGMNDMLVFLSIIPAFLQWDRVFEKIGNYKTLYIVLISSIISIAVIQNGFDGINVVGQIRNKAFNLPLSIKTVMEQETEFMNPLPESIISEIGDSSVTIYPWEVSYCISNNLNYVPLTVIQAYSIYTPYLDNISAKKFLDNQAPKYILLTLDTIDNRWPFIECPQTWEAIRNNYSIKLQEGNLFLLKHKEKVNNINYNLVKTSNYALNEEIGLEGADYLKISANLNIWGNLAKIFWKIPEVNMHVYYSDGTEMTRRVLLDLFSEGVELGTIVASNELFVDILNGASHLGTVSKVVFEGDGLKYYKNTINIEFYISSSDKNVHLNENVKTAYAEEITDVGLSSFEIKEGAIDYFIDLKIGNEQYTKLDGWAYISDTSLHVNYEELDICIEVDGKYYKCNKLSREDVKEAFGLPTDLVGYSITYESRKVGKICIIDMRNRIIYKAVE